ncbi:hypothetical protein GCM10010250_22370 [Streptomyces althioticus]|uniref:phage tail protein n=1 Tax=Streptomyces althioticus TaxID=83380 RepID=UPI0018759D32|nr:hypothetical protein GCM10010250_22370 [Streptomyces althioticus]
MAGEDVDYGRATIRIDIDDSSADGESRVAGMRIQRALLRATRRVGEQMRRQIQRGLSAAPVTVRVEPDLSRFDAQLLTGLRSLTSINVPVAPDVTGFEERLRALLAGIEVPVRVVPDMDGFNDRIRAHRTPDVNVNVNPDTNRFRKALTGLTRVAGKVGKGLTSLLTFGAVGIAAAGAASGVGAFLAALAPAAGILAALPAVVAGFAVASSTLKLALMGVSDAFGAALTGNAEEFEKTLENLSPAAKSAAREVRALKPAFEELRNTVQNALFSQLEGQITKTANALSGPLSMGMTAISLNFGQAAASILKFLQSAQGVAAVTDVMQGTEAATNGLAAGLGPLAEGLLRVAGTVSAAFGDRLGSALQSASEGFGNWLTEASESGRAVQWVETAISVFQQLGQIVSNLGSIISGVFEAGESAGAGFLNNLQLITGQISKFVNSEEGQSALANIFSTIGTIAAQLGPIFSALITQVGQIAPLLAPVFETLGPAIVGVINALGPAIQGIAPALQVVAGALAEAFAAIGPSLGPLGESIGRVLAALAPLLPLVGEIVAMLAGALAPVFSTLAAALAPVISQLVSALAPILPTLAAAFASLVIALTPLATGIGEALAQLIAGLAPIFPMLAQAVVQLVVALVPLITQLTAALLPVLPSLVTAFLAIVNAVLPLVPQIVALVAAVAPLVGHVITLVAPLLKVAAALLGWAAINVVVPLIKLIVAALGGFLGILTRIVSGVTTFVGKVIGFFKKLYNDLVGHSIVPDLVNGVVDWFKRLPRRAVEALASLVSSILGPFKRAASAALGRARSFVTEAVNVIKRLPNRAKEGLGSLTSTLVNAGKDLIRGMINGIKQMAGELVSAAKGVVKGAVDGAKKLLGISSPSKVFAQIGRDTGRGFIEGLTGTQAKIKSTGDKVANSIIKAFEKLKPSKMDDFLVMLIDRSNKNLLRLAAQRDKLAKKIEEANKFATETTKSTLEAFSLSNLVQGQEAFTAQTITAGLEDAVKRVRGFSADLNKLARRGLRKDLLEQIIGLGPEQGAQMAEVLASTTGDQLKRINALQTTLSKVSTTFGRTSADVLFDAGKQASKGFLAGLEAERKGIERLMVQIAKALQKSIRSALGIRSPSVVMRRIGEMTMAGLQVGLVRRLSALEASAGTAARTMVRAVSSEMAGMPGFGAGEVVPLTRGRRLSRNTDDWLAPGRGRAGGDVVHNHTWNIREVGDAHVTAKRVLDRFVLAAGVS